MTTTALITLYAISCIAVLALLVWDTTKCRPFRVKDIPLHVLSAALWPAGIILYLVVFAGICIVERLEGIEEKVIIPSRKKP